MEQELYTVVGPKSWGMMTSHELAKKLVETDVALVPVGAIEQHGGHLPLGQDNYQIEEIVRRAIIKLDADGKKAIFGPTIPFAPISNLKFAGSISSHRLWSCW
jgi:creatinine amidohydrolase